MFNWSNSSQEPPLGAAVDLGSNSFHMIMAQLFPGEVRVIDRQRERVRIAGGILPNRQLDEKAKRRALDCLERFGEQLRNLPQGHVRVVGTNTFRKARELDPFIAQCEEAIGHPIDVISGIEEARLIYLGVVHSSPPRFGRRMVIDIGGGSTEFILGEGPEVIEAESVSIGCVSYSRRFFSDGNLTREAFKRAVTAARVEFLTLTRTFQPSSWDACLGSSGTVHAVEAILTESGWTPGGVTWKGLRKLRKALLAAETIDNLRLPGLKPDRRPVLVGGLAILMAAFESFEIDQMMPTAGGLREGLLYDLHGRFQHEDVRDRTVWSFVRRFQVDESQSLRVEGTALHLLGRVAKKLRLDDDYSRRLISWGARLHEIGLAISHVGYHKHGEYLIRNARMDGFARGDQTNLALLVRLHRKKLLPELFEEFAHIEPEVGRWLVILLRLAVLLHRSRDAAPLPPFEVEARKRKITLTVDRGWLEERPVMEADLVTEASVLISQGYDLIVVGEGIVGEQPE